MNLKTYKKFKGNRLMPWGKATVVTDAKGYIFLSGNTATTICMPFTATRLPVGLDWAKAWLPMSSNRTVITGAKHGYFLL